MNSVSSKIILSLAFIAFIEFGGRKRTDDI